MSLRVVFDTNVMISGLLWRGAPYRCLQLARAGVVEPVYCQEMMRELSAKLVDKFGFSQERLEEFLADWERRATEVTIAGDLRVVEGDPDDDIFVECAAGSGARFLVSGDRHLLRLKVYKGVEITAAATFLEAIRSEPSG